MCLICIDLQKEKLTSHEARRNLNELHLDLEEDHVETVIKLIWKLEDKEKSKEKEKYEKNYFDWNNHRYETD